jgi:hypothetical protein
VSNTRGHPASVVEDGDPHAAIWSDTLRLRTATELHEQVLARDAIPQSATTLQPEEQDSAVGLRAAAARYLDALHLAAEHIADPQPVVPWTRVATCCSTDSPGNLAADPARPPAPFGARRRRSGR